MAFIETSALDATGVDAAFETLITAICKMMNNKLDNSKDKKAVPSGETIQIRQDDEEGGVTSRFKRCCGGE